MDVNEVELAWAAGFYDGEGCTSFANRSRRASCTIGQNHPQVLVRFYRAIGEIGAINGPHSTGRANPYWRWECSGHERVQAVIALLWKHLGMAKRKQAMRVLSRCHREKRHDRTNCKRGHPRTPENTTAYGQCRECARLSDRERRKRTFVPKPRPVRTECGRGHPRTPDNMTKWGQCRECMRISERARQPKRAEVRRQQREAARNR